MEIAPEKLATSSSLLVIGIPDRPNRSGNMFSYVLVCRLDLVNEGVRLRAEKIQFITDFGYRQHQPEQTLLYQIVSQHYPAFVETMQAQEAPLPPYVQQAFSDYLKCGRLEHGFLRVRCERCHHERLVAFSCKKRGFYPSCGARRMAESAALMADEILPALPMRQWVISFPYQLRFLFAAYPHLMGKALSIIYRVISTYLIKQAGQTKRTAKTSAATLIQRFGSALNLNIHFHMLFLDGVYIENEHGRLDFRQIPKPDPQELNHLVHTISHRVARFLERQGLLERDIENTYLQLDAMEPDAMQSLYGHSITYRIAIGPRQGRKAFTLQTVPEQPVEAPPSLVAQTAGFSLHAGVSARAEQRWKRERLCRYISRPAVSEQRLSLTRNGDIRCQLKTLYRDGTTHVIFEPMDFLARLAALVPRPRVNLTRYHGVFAPNSRYRAQVTPAGRGKQSQSGAEPCERHMAMTWGQRLKRVFKIDIEVCEHCGGKVKVIASIEDPLVIGQILCHIRQREPDETAQARQIDWLHNQRAPPVQIH